MLEIHPHADLGVASPPPHGDVTVSGTLVTKTVTCLIALRRLKEFWARHPQAERPIRAWFAVLSKARWHGPADVKRQFGTTVDFVGDNRVIFDLGGNKYRLVAHVSYTFGRVLIKFVGTHAEYERINPETVTWRR